MQRRAWRVTWATVVKEKRRGCSSRAVGAERLEGNPSGGEGAGERAAWSKLSGQRVGVLLAIDYLHVSISPSSVALELCGRLMLTSCNPRDSNLQKPGTRDGALVRRWQGTWNAFIWVVGYVCTVWVYRGECRLLACAPLESRQGTEPRHRARRWRAVLVMRLCRRWSWPSVSMAERGLGLMVLLRTAF